MPFQDIDEVAPAQYPGSPGVVERWLHKIFIEDWFLKLMALAIALLLWLAVTGVNKPVTIRTTIQLNFIRPDKLDISNDPPRSVDVLLTGRRSKLQSIGPTDLVATVDLSDQREGERVVRLAADHVQMDLPDGVKIESFQPSTIPIHLEPIIERQVAVEVKIEGQPAEGFDLYSVRPSPATIAVRGPAGHVNSLQKAPTETISIAGKNEAFTASRVAIDVPDHKIDLEDSAVDVVIEIGEHRTERTFPGVSVIADRGNAQPATVSVTLFGPASVISQLRPEDLKISLTSSGGGVEPHLNVPPGIQDRVSLKSLKPSSIAIIR
ncbi:MAG TPA: CdaR family protein [Pyrinomonadaceae bacterium]|nr:CdaR family protein [Pyrinomonadaceae bacterium]